MKKLLFIDTETTGLPSNYDLDYSNTNNWPRLVQIAWQLYNEEGVLLETSNFIIKPEGFTIPQNSIKIHNIDNEKALNEGEELVIVLFKFLEVLSKSNFLIGHNINFDEKVVGCELFRKHFDTSKLSLIAKFCSMKDGKVIKFCDLNGKRPTLNELYNKLFRENITNTHNAMSDVSATSKCYFELVERGIIQLNKNNTENSPKVNTVKSVQTNFNLTDWRSKDAVKNQIDEIPILNSLTKMFQFENRYTIKNNKKSPYDNWDGDYSLYDEEEYHDYMIEMIRDDEDDDFFEQEEKENNIALEKQLDEFSLNWRDRFNEIIVFNNNISIGKKVNKYFFLNGDTGEFLSSDSFELIHVINNDTVIVQKNGEFGMMDSLLQEILPFEYSQFISYDNIFFVTLKFDSSKNILINSKNSRYQLYHINRFFVLNSEYEELSYFNYGLFKVKKVGLVGQYGLINVRGELLLGHDYFDFYNLSDSCPEYFTGESKFNVTLFRFNIENVTIEKILVIDANEVFFKKIGKNGELILQTKKGESYGLLDVYRKKYTPCVYKKIEYLNNENLIKVGIESGYSGELYYGLLSINFTELLPCRYSEIAPFMNGKSIVKINDKFQVINLNGELINDEKFIFASHVKNGFIAFVNGSIDTIKIGIIFKDSMKMNKLTLGLLTNQGTLILQQKWERYFFKAIFEEIDCDEMLIYILRSLKESVNKYVSFDEYCNDYTNFTEQMLQKKFNLNYKEIDQHIIDIKSGNAFEVKSKIF